MLAEFPDTRKSTGWRIGKKEVSGVNIAPAGKYKKGDPGFGDSGSAARFFYCAKASKSERNRGCEELEEKLKSGTEFRPSYLKEYEEKETNGTPRARFGKMQNNHPTVKPIALMEYLIKLVTREGALILDPFAGSGTTGIAAQNLNRKYILIEQDAEYCNIAEHRLQHDNNLFEKL